MQICRFVADGQVGLGLLEGETVRDLRGWHDGALASMAALLALPLAELRPRLVAAAAADLPALRLGVSVTLLAPVDQQEVWACGVTYERSRDARMEEAREKSIYDRVYEAERPEIFFKATGPKVVAPNAPVRIRRDSTWDVPEPEAALVINRHLELIGLTVGNDMSSRSIEGENPLYLAQAKVYDASCALGPAIRPIWELPTANRLAIGLRIDRAGAPVFQGDASTAQIRRPFEYLISYLGRDQSFPHGAVLLTGTGIVPPNDFTLQPGDVVHITIEEVGTLVNPVTRAG
ncbi:MAG: fumarylacetoacetate hydrolase family protein [Chloroflexi bacterium]|nr:fumarylacetoacetate hydrolase family protein [Chloroflexota bacterium]